MLIFFTTFGTVFVAEIVGDKLLYTTGVLAARYRTLPITLGMAAAFMAKMGVAVLVGEAISRLPPILVASITAISFLGVAFALWRKPDQPTAKDKNHTASKAAMVSFAAIFFSEWGDVGQVTAATLAARYRLPLIVWLGCGRRDDHKRGPGGVPRCRYSKTNSSACLTQSCALCSRRLTVSARRIECSGNSH